MKDISNYLISFLKEEFIQPNHIKKPVLSELANTYLNTMYTQIENANKSWNRNKQFVVKGNYHSSTYLPKGKHYQYIIEAARTCIEKHKKIGGIFRFEVLKHPVTVTMVYPVDGGNDSYNEISKEKLEHFFWECLQKIYMWLTIAYSYNRTKCSQTLDIYLYFTDCFKLLPDNKRTALDQTHANTAFTFACKENNEINIFREEEWFKVLIHETFHSLGLDFSESYELSAYSKTKVSEVFRVNSEVNLFETYCEMHALIFNVLFCVYWEGYTMKTIQEFLLYEYVFAGFQRSKVLNHYEMNCTDIYENNIASLQNKKYIEQTNILSYYILKPILLLNLNAFLEWMMNRNKGSLQFELSKENIDAYCDLMLKTNQYTEYNILCDKWLTWIKHHQNINTIETKTMRLSAIEF